MIEGKISTEVNYQPYNAVVHEKGTIGSKTVDLEENVVAGKAQSNSVNDAGTHSWSNSKSEHL